MVSENYIAQRIRELRKNANMDVDTVGRGVGRSGKTVSAWETGRNVPSADMLISICKFFNVDIDYFYPPEVTSSNSQPDVLSASERELIELWRRMDERQRERILADMRDFALANDAKNKDAARDKVAGTVDAVK